MKSAWRSLLVFVFGIGLSGPAWADVGDPQIKTDHPWYPGELAISTFDRLRQTQAEVFQRVTGKRPVTDEQKALASWLWRCTHYAHAEEGQQDLNGKGVSNAQNWTRDYWTGLFSYGFSLCGTTHAQWSAEMETLLGHGRSRVVGVDGHSSFEVFLKGGPYGDGKWVLLDHDISTVVYDPTGRELLSIAEISKDLNRLIDPKYHPERQHGWPVCGLYLQDGQTYAHVYNADAGAGYAGPPPMVHLRRGESLRRYLRPGLEDGKTFVFWGRDYNKSGIPGPERNLTWVNQPEKMYKGPQTTPSHTGQIRYGNAVFTYRPDFASGDYREGAVEDRPDHVTFEFVSPYIIAATPAGKGHWGVHEPGCRNGLVVKGKGGHRVSVSTDSGKTWKDAGQLDGTLDLTDHVKGRLQYWLRVGAGAEKLKGSGLEVVTVCQANETALPRLKDGGTHVTFAASGHALASAGPELDLAKAHVVDGGFDTPSVTMELKTPRGEPADTVYAAAQVFSGNPPSPDVKYQIDFSTDGGASWSPVVKDWTVAQPGDWPKDFWSSSLYWGSAPVKGADSKAVRVRFRNDGKRKNTRGEMHLAYRTGATDGTEVTFDWVDDAGPHRSTHLVSAERPAAWDVATGKGVKTRWVEMRPVTGSGRSK